MSLDHAGNVYSIRNAVLSAGGLSAVLILFGGLFAIPGGAAPKMFRRLERGRRPQ